MIMIVIIKYNAGNIRSVQNSLNRLGYENIVSDDPSIIQNATKVIFPGVGEASSAMRYLKEKGLDKIIINLKQPVLGICLGLQLMCSESEEGNTKCLGIFPNKVSLFSDDQIVPHMGWNNLKIEQSQIMNDLPSESDVYFVHSYYAELSEFTSSTCEYGRVFSASLEQNNFYATQFHPEKSADIGEEILKNFLEL